MTNSILEMTLDQTGNLINQCAPKGSPTILKVEKLDEAGAAETVIKITYCSGRDQQANGTAAIRAQRERSPHRQQVELPVHQQAASPVKQSKPPTPTHIQSSGPPISSPVGGTSPPGSPQPSKYLQEPNDLVLCLSWELI